mmetsp:Transcript_75671/g.202545  ORF Transcript_75671/g.202545 Transcript_75671/m.202545 type:complete len:217 (-) Transcript_75671:685-1335(-)
MTDEPSRGKQASQSRCVVRSSLTAEQAVQIYTYRRCERSRFAVDADLTGNSTRVGEKFNVSPKTVRDIWNRRSWIEETKHLWEEGEAPTLRAKAHARMEKQPDNAQNYRSVKTQSETFHRQPSARSNHPHRIADPGASRTVLKSERRETSGLFSEWTCGCPPLQDVEEDPFKQDSHLTTTISGRQVDSPQNLLDGGQSSLAGPTTAHFRSTARRSD